MISFITFTNTRKRVENTTRSRVFLNNCKVFGNAMKHFWGTFNVTSSQSKLKLRSKLRNKVDNSYPYYSWLSKPLDTSQLWFCLFWLDELLLMDNSNNTYRYCKDIFFVTFWDGIEVILLWCLQKQPRQQGWYIV